MRQEWSRTQQIVVSACIVIVILAGAATTFKSAAIEVWAAMIALATGAIFVVLIHMGQRRSALVLGALTIAVVGGFFAFYVLGFSVGVLSGR